MSKIKDNDLIIKELGHTACVNKEHIKYKTIIANINGTDYFLRISGVGAKAIRCDLYLSYEDIQTKKDTNKLESQLYEMINTVYDI